MSPGATLGVLIPTRNSAALLPAHIAAMASWVELADELVVVDSFSTDNTLDLLREGLRGRPVRFLSHPPGLYASWNFGIQQLSSDFTYISTVGDTISRTGLERLLAAAVGLQADVVISKPDFKRPDGTEAHRHWPIDEAVRSLPGGGAHRLHPWEAILFAATHSTAALTGSCASDLFRTEVLQRWPFPTEFGTAGDGVWGIRYAPMLSWAALSDRFSTYLLHSTDRSQAENRPAPNAPHIEEILREAAKAWRRAGAVDDSALQALRWEELMSTLGEYLAAKAEFDAARRKRWPWCLNPSAWRARVRRNRQAAQLGSLRAAGLEKAQAARRQTARSSPCIS